MEDAAFASDRSVTFQRVWGASTDPRADGVHAAAKARNSGCG